MTQPLEYIFIKDYFPYLTLNILYYFLFIFNWNSIHTRLFKTYHKKNPVTIGLKIKKIVLVLKIIIKRKKRASETSTNKGKKKEVIYCLQRRMSLNNDIEVTRGWMYERIDGSTNQVSETFCQGLESFMEFAKNQPLFLENGKLFCPCCV